MITGQGAAEPGIAVKDLLDLVEPPGREPFSEKRKRLEGLGVKGHRYLSKKYREKSTGPYKSSQARI